MTSLRDALAAKRRQHATYPIPVASAAETEAAAGGLAVAERVKRAAAVGDDADRQATADAGYEQARAAFEACYHVLELEALSPDEYEALKAAHPPVDRDGDEDVDVATFRPALIAACSVGSDLTEQEWAAELSSDRWSQGERSQLYLTVLAINVQMPGGMAPKG